MTPEETKAKELIEKFYKAQVEILNKETSVIVEVEEAIAKESALICADEIIKTLDVIENDFFKNEEYSQGFQIVEKVKYWNKVKQSIKQQ